MIAESLRRAGSLALDLIYPPRCVLCERHGSFLCVPCLARLPRAEGSRCDRCWLPLQGGDCRACAEHPTSLTRLRSLFRYEGEVRTVVHAFKFRGVSALAPELAAALAGCYREHHLDADCIVAVPLSGARRRSRGYNQAALLAEGVAKEVRVPTVAALRRRVNTPAQASSASAEQRRRNVIGAFELAPGAEVSGRRVLLIDDVATTGATLNACAEALLAGGAREVSGLTLARED